MNDDYVLKSEAVEYVLKHHYDEIREAINEQEADNKLE